MQKLSGRLTILPIITALLFPMASLASGTPNDMIRGGCSSVSACRQDIENSDLRSFYTSRGVSMSDFNSGEMVNGTVTRSGRVIIHEDSGTFKQGDVVATGARSFGREDMPGSTKVGPVFERPTSVSFQSSSLTALVHMKGGRFDFAIVKECGNLVIAQPKVPIKKVVHSQPAPVVVVQQQQQQQQAPAPAPLPQTGAAATAGLAGFTSILVVAWYYIRSRRSLAVLLKQV